MNMSKKPATLLNSIHKTFDGKVIDAATLSAAFILNGLAVMQDAKMDHPKARVIDFVRSVDMNDIHSFTPSQH
jgi:hypothetical protein